MLNVNELIFLMMSPNCSSFGYCNLCGVFDYQPITPFQIFDPVFRIKGKDKTKKNKTFISQSINVYFPQVRINLKLSYNSNSHIK